MLSSALRSAFLLLAAACLLPACAGLSGDAGERSRPGFAVPASAWDSSPERMPDSFRHTPVRITLHHAGTLWKPGSDPRHVLRALQRYGRREKGWPDVPYHFVIAPDGRTFEGRALGYAGDTNTGYDTAGQVQVELWGDFEQQRVSLAQLEALVRLLAWLERVHGIPPTQLATHRDRTPATLCPGRDLQRYVEGGDVVRWVEQVSQGAAPDIALRPPLAEGPRAFVPAD